MDAIEKRARELLADIANLPLRASDDEVVALIAAALTPPEGYVLVPVEPTEDMIEAYHSVEAVTARSDEDADDQWAIESYRAMIAARPEVP